jgi:DNA-binding winged helix-turn-helix (wHTH) protein/Tol biopolymer transport system component
MAPRTHPRVVRFGRFEFDPESGDLSKSGRRIKLQNQPRQVLTLLLQRRGELVTREELRRQLWPADTFVDFDSGLNVAIRKIRDALGDATEAPRFIETERARGYRFVAPATDIDAPAAPIAAPPGVSMAVGEQGDAGSPGNRETTSARADRRRLPHWIPPWNLGFGFLILAGVATGLVFDPKPSPRPPRTLVYSQITNFTDSAVDPALSPDGRMVAFYRSERRFLTTDQIWIKMLPDGEAVQLTNLPDRKYGLAFSPDGARLAFTMAPTAQPTWRTFTIPALGGEPSPFLENAAGLTWIDEDEVLFSEVESGLHMGIVASRTNRLARRALYFPRHDRAMAHFSYLSPDRRWVLVIEMNHEPVWQPCRVVPFDGSSPGWIVGPRGHCTSAAWSPDGAWMYFTVSVDGTSHLWRQRFPRGEPEQLTSGPDEAMGVAVFPDGRSLVTSVGVQKSAVWIRDRRGDRPLTSQGHVESRWFSSVPRFAADGRYLYYLLRRDSPASPAELWRTDIETERTERVLSGFSIAEYDVAADGRNVVFSTQAPDGESELWLGSLLGEKSPTRIGSLGDGSPYFRPDGSIAFRLTEQDANYLAVMRADGSARRTIAPFPIATIQTLSPDGGWAVAVVPSVRESGSSAGCAAIPLAGGEPRRICPTMCHVRWAADGSFLYVTVLEQSRTQPGRTLAIPLAPGEMLPALPPEGIRGVADLDRFPGARLIDEGRQFAPSPTFGTYAFVSTTTHRNLFRIGLP